MTSIVRRPNGISRPQAQRSGRSEYEERHAGAGNHDEPLQHMAAGISTVASVDAVNGPARAQSVYSQCALEKRRLHSQCTVSAVSAQSVHSQCTVTKKLVHSQGAVSVYSVCSHQKSNAPSVHS